MIDSKHRTIILIAGNAGHGKNTAGDIINLLLLTESDNSVSVTQDAFARSLKDIMHQIFDVGWEVLNGDKYVKENTSLKLGNIDTGLTVRDGLQSIGSFFRNKFHERVWAHSFIKRFAETNYDFTIVTDCRYPEEELVWIKDTLEGNVTIVAVRIINPRIPIDTKHESEYAIANADNSLFDYVVYNNGSLDDLRNNLKPIVDNVLSRHVKVQTTKDSKKRS